MMLCVNEIGRRFKLFQSVTFVSRHVWRERKIFHWHCRSLSLWTHMLLHPICSCLYSSFCLGIAHKNKRDCCFPLCFHCQTHAKWRCCLILAERCRRLTRNSMADEESFLSKLKEAIAVRSTGRRRVLSFKFSRCILYNPFRSLLQTRLWDRRVRPLQIVFLHLRRWGEQGIYEVVSWERRAERLCPYILWITLEALADCARLGPGMWDDPCTLCKAW